jgi:hypothetical protein
MLSEAHLNEGSHEARYSVCGRRGCHYGLVAASRETQAPGLTRALQVLDRAAAGFAASLPVSADDGHVACFGLH